jgi:hypothetical protein
MIIKSNWKLTLGALVILDYGSEMPEELKFPQANGLDVVPTPDSAWPLLLDTGNSAVRIKVAVYATAADDKVLRADLLDSLVTRAAETVTTLKLEVYGYTDRYWTFAQCRSAEYEPTVVVTTRGPKTLRTYMLTCAGLARTGP